VAGKWNKLVFDFSRPNDWVNNGTGQPINNKRIKQILFDMHNADFNWPPPPNYTGKFMVRNIRVGSQADFTPTYTATVNAVANQVAFPNLTSQAIGLSGLSNGKGNAAGVTVSVASSNPAVVTGVEVGGVEASGNARLTYSTGGSTGKSTITLTVAADGLGEQVGILRHQRPLGLGRRRGHRGHQPQPEVPENVRLRYFLE
jgi:hypothetical protein